MAAKITFEAIVPKTPLTTKLSIVTTGRVLRNYGTTVQRRLSSYPSSQSDYVRTGTLGRGWTTDGPRSEGIDLVITVGNVTDYAEIVQGPDRGKAFSSAGWPRVDVVGTEEWDKARREIELLVT